MDEFTRECLAIRVGRKLGSAEVIDVLADLFVARGTPGYVRSDNGPEFIATAVKGWIGGVGAKTAFIEPGSPWGETRPASSQWLDDRVERLRRELQRQAAGRAAER